MKKFLAIILLCCMLSMMSGCSLIDDLFGSSAPDYDTSQNGSNNSGNNNTSNNNSDDNKYMCFIDGQMYRYDTYNKIKVKPDYKAGYVFHGYYTAKNGDGALMIDYLGNAVNSVSWTKGWVNYLYPYYEEIDYAYVYNSRIIFNETTSTYSYNIYNEPKICYWDTSKEENFEYIHKVALSNPDIKLNLAGFAEIKDEPTIFSIGVGSEYSGELSKQMYPAPEIFMTARADADIKGVTITNNSRIWIGLFCTKFGHYGIVKNVRFKISIIKDAS